MKAVYNSKNNTLEERPIYKHENKIGMIYPCDDGLKCILENGKEYKCGEDFDLFECDHCDGCGWIEGGLSLKNTCKKCGGIGVIAILPKFLKEHHDKVVKEQGANEMHDIPCHSPKSEEDQDAPWDDIWKQIRKEAFGRNKPDNLIEELKTKYIIITRKP